MNIPRTVYMNFGTWHFLEPNYFNGPAELQGDLVRWAHGEQEREAS